MTLLFFIVHFMKPFQLLNSGIIHGELYFHKITKVTH